MSQRPLAATRPTLHEVLDCASAEKISAARLIGDDLGRLVTLRDQVNRGIAAGTPLYRCPYCKGPVYIRAHRDQRAQHFAHRWDEGRDVCPAAEARSLHTLDQLSAQQFRGKQEGARHKRLKSLVFHSLIADPAFTDVHVERRVTSEQGTFRRPDVSATFASPDGPLRIAFEIQLSTTAARIMAERKEFYAGVGGLLVWILDGYDASAWQSLTMQHAFYPNRQNALIANDTTLSASLEAHALTLECFWREPSPDGGATGQRRLVRFDELTLDVPAQQAYYFDFDAAEARMQGELRVEGIKALQREIIRCLMRRNRSEDDWETKRQQWRGLQQRLSVVSGLQLPDWNDERSGFFRKALLVLSMHQRRSVATHHDTLTELVHQVVHQHSHSTWLTLCAIAAYGTWPTLLDQDRTGGLRRKLLRTVLPGLRDGTPEFTPEREFDPILTFLFPRLAEHYAESPQAALGRESDTPARAAWWSMVSSSLACSESPSGSPMRLSGPP